MAAAGEGAGEFFMAPPSEVLGVLDEEKKRRARRAIFLQDVYTDTLDTTQPEAEMEPEPELPAAPPQLIALLRHLHTMTEAAFGLAMQAAAQELLGRAKDTDIDTLACAPCCMWRTARSKEPRLVGLAHSDVYTGGR